MPALLSNNQNAGVALRKESVDRNIGRLLKCYFMILSLSARRAWIEIAAIVFVQFVNGESLSARRAWIEITNRRRAVENIRRRSPQGERG